jgi:hypothetical protein
MNYVDELSSGGKIYIPYFATVGSGSLVILSVLAKYLEVSVLLLLVGWVCEVLISMAPFGKPIHTESHDDWYRHLSSIKI